VTTTVVAPPLGEPAKSPDRESRTPLESVLSLVPTWLVVVACAAVTGAATSVRPVYGAVMTVAIAVLLVGLARPAAIAYALVALAPITPGLRRGLVVPNLRLSEILIAGSAALVITTAGRTARGRWQALDWFAGLYVALTMGLGLITATLYGHSLTTDNINKLLGPVQFFLLYRTVRLALPRPEQRSRALSVLLLSSAPVALITVLQQFNIGPTRGWIINATASATAPSSAASGIIRATGPFAHYHSLAGYLVVIILLAVALLFTPGQTVLRRSVLVPLTAAAAIALACTATLVTLAAAMVGVLILAIRARQPFKLLLLLGGVSLAGLTGIGPNLSRRVTGQIEGQLPTYTLKATTSWLPPNVAFRVEVWRDQYLPVVSQHLLLGYGPGVPASVTWDSTESLYITLLMRGGVPLLLAFVALVVAMWMAARAAERSPESQDHALGLTLTTVVLVMTFMHVIHPYFTDAGFPHALWILLALLPSQVRSRGHAGERLMAPVPRDEVRA
jgi:hypothetical protein